METGLMVNALTRDERARYARHLALPEVGAAGQLRLKAARVLIVGAGGLGSPVCLYLAAAGIGTLGIIDSDRVERSNLQRQVLYGEEDLGQLKATKAAQRIRDNNPNIYIKAHCERLSAQNASELVKEYDVIIDGTDNQATRYLLNDVCYFESKPLVYGSVYRFEGQASVFNFNHSPCYRCLYPQPASQGVAANCSEAGVLGVLPAVIGSIQATEAIKIITKLGGSLNGRLLVYNALDMRCEEFNYAKNPDCGLCGDKATIGSLEEALGLYKQQDRVSSNVQNISVEELKRKLSEQESLTVIDVRETNEWVQYHINGSTNIPLNELEKRYYQLSRDKEIIVLCQSGGRSIKACGLLTNLGFQNINNLQGGINAWLASER